MNGWLVVTWANRDYHAHMIASASQFAELVDIPDNYPKRHFVLNGSQLLIGRRSRSRGIEPDIDLTGPLRTQAFRIPTRSWSPTRTAAGAWWTWSRPTALIPSSMASTTASRPISRCRSKTETRSSWALGPR